MSDNTLQHDFDDELLSAYLDDELSADQRALVEARLADDPAARQTLEQLRHVSQAVRELPPQSPSGGLRDSILQRVTDANRAATASVPSDSAPSLPKFTIGRTRRGWIWASLAVAAALLIMFVAPDELEDEAGRSIAQRRREPPSLTAAPETAPPAPAQPSARDLAERESTVSLEAAGEAASEGASAVHSRVAEESRVADDLASGPLPEYAEPIDEDELVVVHVLAKRAALENRAFDQLLLSNGIALMPVAPAEIAAASADRYRTLASSSRAAGQAAPQLADDEADVDVVLVEAPPTKIKSFLSDLNQDYANYLSVSVDDSAPADASTTPQAGPSKKLAVDLKQYNRGNVPQQQKEFLDRNKAFYYEQSPEGRYDYLGGGARGALDTVSGAEQKEGRLAHENIANQARAQRVQVSKAEAPRADKVGKLRQWKAPRALDPDNLQVLFVLAPGEESAASPGAENRAE